MMRSDTASQQSRLTLGPLLFHWPPEKIRDFYFRIADEAPVDTVHIGEAVCAKRLPLIEKALEEARERLLAAGKEVVLSSLAIIADEKDMAPTAALSGEPDLLVEANDIAALAGLDGRPHVIGPFVNVYNEDTLSFLARRGAVRICLPPEMHKDAIAALAAKSDAELEIFAFGRVPLALSARCYHARVNDLHKDNCRFVCNQDPDGMTVETLTGAPFLVVNGVQTLSFAYNNLIADLADLQELGVNRFRLSPHDVDMIAVAEIFRNALDGEIDAEEALDCLACELPIARFANGFFHRVEGMTWKARSAGIARPARH
ncbi:MAG: U32 family peptidase [Parvularculaceae bacterium]